MIPQILAPRMKVSIPNRKENIYVKPYTVKIEKTMIASDNSNIFDTIKIMYGVVKECILDNSINVDNLRLGEFLYLFMQIQKISTNENLELTRKHGSEGNEHEFKMSVNLNDLKLDEYEKGFTVNVATAEGEYIVEVDHPKVKDYLLDIPKEDIESTSSALYISAMYSKDGNNELDLSLEDKKEIFECLPLYEVQEIGKLVQNTPMPYIDVDVECPICHEHIKEKMDSFFI